MSTPKIIKNVEKEFWQPITLVDIDGVPIDPENPLYVSSISLTDSVPEKITVTENGTITGKSSVTFICSSDFDGSILGDIAKPDGIYTFTANAGGLLAEINFTINIGNLEILSIA